jgi:hypothetical protein
MTWHWLNYGFWLVIEFIGHQFLISTNDYIVYQQSKWFTVYYIIHPWFLPRPVIIDMLGCELPSHRLSLLCSAPADPSSGSGMPTCIGVLWPTRKHKPQLELEFFLRLTVSQPVRLGIGPPFATLDQILSCSSFSSNNYFILRSKAPSLTRKRVCSLQCNHSLVRSLTPNHTLRPHLRLCSLFVASYDSQGLRWKYSNPPPHRAQTTTAPWVLYSYSLPWIQVSTRYYLAMEVSVI